MGRQLTALALVASIALAASCPAHITLPPVDAELPTAPRRCPYPPEAFRRVENDFARDWYPLYGPDPRDLIKHSIAVTCTPFIGWSKDSPPLWISGLTYDKGTSILLVDAPPILLRHPSLNRLIYLGSHAQYPSLDDILRTYRHELVHAVLWHQRGDPDASHTPHPRTPGEWQWQPLIDKQP